MAGLPTESPLVDIAAQEHMRGVSPVLLPREPQGWHLDHRPGGMAYRIVNPVPEWGHRCYDASEAIL